MALHRTGECRCGKVQFEVNQEPMITMACHCKGCQQMTASAYSLSELFPSAAFRITVGDPVLGGLQADTDHYFCPHCKSWLFTRPQGVGDVVNVRATLMEDAQSFSPYIETCTDEMLPWAKTGATHSFEKFPAEDDFPKLMAAYASRKSKKAVC